jgi:hypothetical protein
MREFLLALVGAGLLSGAEEGNCLRQNLERVAKCVASVPARIHGAMLALQVKKGMTDAEMHRVLGQGCCPVFCTSHGRIESMFWVFHDHGVGVWCEADQNGAFVVKELHFAPLLRD